jgi:hypothetical protein
MNYFTKTNVTKMKSGKLIKIGIGVLLSTHIMVGQSTMQGIYLTGNDFSKRKLAHASPHTHIKLHEVFKTDIVEVKCNDSLFSYKKSDVFGYKDNTGQSYRFFDKKIYPILNSGEKILIYKIQDKIGFKGQAPVESYHFSRDAGSPIYLLTISNLETAFSENKEFQKLLEIHFSNDNQLIEYDKQHGEYKLNRILELSQTGKINE